MMHSHRKTAGIMTTGAKLEILFHQGPWSLSSKRDAILYVFERDFDFTSGTTVELAKFIGIN